MDLFIILSFTVLVAIFGVRSDRLALRLREATRLLREVSRGELGVIGSACVGVCIDDHIMRAIDDFVEEAD